MASARTRKSRDPLRSGSVWKRHIPPAKSTPNINSQRFTSHHITSQPANQPTNQPVNRPSDNESANQPIIEPQALTENNNNNNNNDDDDDGNDDDNDESPTGTVAVVCIVVDWIFKTDDFVWLLQSGNAPSLGKSEMDEWWR